MRRSGHDAKRMNPRRARYPVRTGVRRRRILLGGVYRRLYDNLGPSVKKILRGHRRETARFVAFRSHR